MLPQVSPEEILHPSEEVVYKALSALPDGYVVMHSYPWLRPNRSLKEEPLREGEADFLVLHPQKGMLVLEVKGGQNIQLKERTWYRGGKEMRDPFDQARRNKYALLDAVKERTKGRIDRDSFAHGEVVVFPHDIYKGHFPLNTDARTLIDANGLSGMTARIEAAFLAWHGPRGPSTQAEYAALLDALLPKMQLTRCVGADIQDESTRLMRLTTNQQATMLGLLANNRVLVEGGAGSGKTLLAVEFAVSLAEQGRRVLLLCFNSQLATWLDEQAVNEKRLIAAPGALTVDTFHSFALKIARLAGVEFDVPKSKSEAEHFWDTEASQILDQAIELLRGTKDEVEFDAVVVDEAQDFCPYWWLTVEGLLAGGPAGALHVFMDLHQSLRGLVEPPPVALPVRFRLDINCRNTRSIARSAAEIIGVTVRLLPGAPEGEAPGLRRAPADKAQSGLVQSEIRQLLAAGVKPSQIVIIGPASHWNGSLGRVKDVDGVQLVNDAAKWRAGQGVLVTTARSFKGLEADVVVLYDLQSFGDLFTKTDLYVAWTRAKHRLIAICHGPEVRAQIEAALAGGP